MPPFYPTASHLPEVRHPLPQRHRFIPPSEGQSLFTTTASFHSTFRRCAVSPRFPLTFRRCVDAQPQSEHHTAAFHLPANISHLPKVRHFPAFSAHLPKVSKRSTASRAPYCRVPPPSRPFPPSEGEALSRIFRSPSEGVSKPRHLPTPSEGVKSPNRPWKSPTLVRTSVPTSLLPILPQRHHFPQLTAVAATRSRRHPSHRPVEQHSPLEDTPQRHRFPQFAAVAATRFALHAAIT